MKCFVVNALRGGYIHSVSCEFLFNISFVYEFDGRCRPSGNCANGMVKSLSIHGGSADSRL